MTITFACGSGRILQASVRGRDAFWVATQPAGWNLGGDRLWLGPERDWFWAGAARDDLTKHLVPAEIDPGNWDVVHERPDGVDLVLTATLRDRNTGAPTSVIVERHITVRADTRYVAEYETETVLHVQSGQAVDAWSIVQVPLGGRLEIGVTGEFSFRDHLSSPVDPSRFAVADSVATIDLAGQHMTKFGVTSSVATGLLRYTRPGLVIERHIDVHPGGDYRDGPYQQTGDVIQVFEDDGHYGGYAELEHHSIAAQPGQTVLDRCRTVIRAT
ncbi:hypothetical protein [Kutzneria kofuensis]|uniref:Uncharacterized protein YndB with AHSA1/START domain n=1 Tax=Kutzneria kofuensis TaxID=103725 RepID=A0A7W9KA97_9PSEU|nr:hypothetical protein [Kutzneria kofuensis]MBB5888912.1 uncharacterized protein YndB with AHSA1/START domain [Kutzneria kofuensis]